MPVMTRGASSISPESEVRATGRPFVGARPGPSLKGIGALAVEAALLHTWPGNARELENRVKRAVIMAENNRIAAEDLELVVPDESMPLNLRQVREEAERRAIERALALYNGNVSQAADILGVSRPTLYDLVKKYDLR